MPVVSQKVAVAYRVEVSVQTADRNSSWKERSALTLNSLQPKRVICGRGIGRANSATLALECFAGLPEVAAVVRGNDAERGIDVVVHVGKRRLHLLLINLLSR